MPAQTVLEELTRDELTNEHVQRRVDDWAERIEKLYKQVESCCRTGGLRSAAAQSRCLKN